MRRNDSSAPISDAPPVELLWAKQVKRENGCLQNHMKEVEEQVTRCEESMRNAEQIAIACKDVTDRVEQTVVHLQERIHANEDDSEDRESRQLVSSILDRHEHDLAKIKDSQLKMSRLGMDVRSLEDDVDLAKKDHDATEQKLAAVESALRKHERLVLAIQAERRQERVATDAERNQEKIQLQNLTREIKTLKTTNNNLTTQLKLLEAGSSRQKNDIKGRHANTSSQPDIQVPRTPVQERSSVALQSSPSRRLMPKVRNDIQKEARALPTITESQSSSQITELDTGSECGLEEPAVSPESRRADANRRKRKRVIEDEPIVRENPMTQSLQATQKVPQRQTKIVRLPIPSRHMNKISSRDANPGYIPRVSKEQGFQEGRDGRPVRDSPRKPVRKAPSANDETRKEPDLDAFTGTQSRYAFRQSARKNYNEHQLSQPLRRSGVHDRPHPSRLPDKPTLMGPASKEPGGAASNSSPAKQQTAQPAGPSAKTRRRRKWPGYEDA